MPDIRLETAAGKYVATVQLPAQSDLPGVITYGNRHYTNACGLRNGMVYREAVSYAVPPGRTFFDPANLRRKRQKEEGEDAVNMAEDQGTG